MTNERSDDVRRVPRAGTPPAGALRSRFVPAMAFAATMILVGCDSDPLAILDESPPAPQTAEQAAARARSDAAVAAAADKPTPDLRSVPERPEVTSTPTTREKVVEGLIADRANARYTDEAIRLQGEGRTAPPPNASTTAAAAPPPAPAVEKTMPQPEMPKPETAAPASPVPEPAVEAMAKPEMPERMSPPAPSTASVPQVAAVPPPPPRAPTPVPAAPEPAAPEPMASRSAPAPATADRAAQRSGGAVVVDRTALDGLGSASGVDPLAARSAGGQVATIQFANSSSRLDDRDRAILRQVAAIQRQSGGSLVVVGHASSRTQQLDKVEHELANLHISMARANAVADALVASGVARELVTVEAVSDAQPVYTEAMPTGEAGNRRAEIFLVQ